jgi:hypothetical protein
MPMTPTTTATDAARERLRAWEAEQAEAEALPGVGDVEGHANYFRSHLTAQCTSS